MVVIVVLSALWRRGVPAVSVGDADADADAGRPNDAPPDDGADRDVRQRLNDVNLVLLEQHEIHILTV
ncbi:MULTISPECIES: hypothetical protein [unclassified Frankia]|uniref:hypothetical protein n=1 Tax=unclassified Frankia TaxID=2632575 RepID=UPI002AD4BF5A|nr:MULTISPECIES: hypothetical protein [unclassified Frankia]